MENAVIPYFTADTIRNLRTLQDREHVSRVVTGEYEPVIFPPSSSFRFWVNKESLDFKLHWHASTEIVVPIDHPVTVHIRQQEYILHPGDIFVIPSGELHDLLFSQQGFCLVFLYDLSVLQPIKGFPYLNSTFSKPVLISAQDSIYDKEMNLLYDMFQDYYSQSSLRELMIFSKMIDFYVDPWYTC